MDQSLIQVGLPVRCSTCLTTGFVKPGTNYGGWRYVKLLGKKRWYCPKDAKIALDMHQKIADKYKTPEPEVAPEDETKELYKLLDD